jgi:hypothetical protein
MRIQKLLFSLVLCCALTAGYGLAGCGDEDDPPAPCPDNDGDGYGRSASPTCTHPELDCDDTAPDVYPDAPELCDGIDKQCPGDAGHLEVDEGLSCFEGGSFAFTIGDIEDSCLGGNLESQLPPGEQLAGPLQLPDPEDLPITIEIPFGPPIGTVDGELSQDGEVFGVAGTDEIEVDIPGVGIVTATLTGGLRPVTNSWVFAIFTLRVTAAPAPVVTPCNVRIGATGVPQ